MDGTWELLDHGREVGDEPRSRAEPRSRRCPKHMSYDVCCQSEKISMCMLATVSQYQISRSPWQGSQAESGPQHRLGGSAGTVGGHAFSDPVVSRSSTSRTADSPH